MPSLENFYLFFLAHKWIYLIRYATCSIVFVIVFALLLGIKSWLSISRLTIVVVPSVFTICLVLDIFHYCVTGPGDPVVAQQNPAVTVNPAVAYNVPGG